jgi:hypothetical protein
MGSLQPGLGITRLVDNGSELGLRRGRSRVDIRESVFGGTDEHHAELAQLGPYRLPTDMGP